MIARPKPPPHDELEALIKEARARQLRSRLLGAAGIAVAAATGLSAGAKAVVWLQWFNWCGKPVPVRFALRFLGLQLTANRQAGGRCDSAHHPSGIFVSVLRQPQ